MEPVQIRSPTFKCQICHLLLCGFQKATKRSWTTFSCEIRNEKPVQRQFIVGKMWDKRYQAVDSQCRQPEYSVNSCCNILKQAHKTSALDDNTDSQSSDNLRGSTEVAVSGSAQTEYRHFCSLSLAVLFILENYLKVLGYSCCFVTSSCPTFPKPS